MPFASLKIKSPLGTVLTFHIFIATRNRRYFKRTIFLVVKYDERNSRGFFFPEREKQTHLTMSNNNFVVKLRLPGKSVALSSFFKLASLVIFKSRFSLPNLSTYRCFLT